MLASAAFRHLTLWGWLAVVLTTNQSPLYGAFSVNRCVRAYRERASAAYARTQQNAQILLYRGLIGKVSSWHFAKISGSKWPTEKAGRAVHTGQLARCRSAEDAVLCPSDMMLCVISYWVLSGAKRRQIQQLRCCVFPRQAVETEGCLSEINTTQRTSRDPRHL